VIWSSNATSTAQRGDAGVGREDAGVEAVPDHVELGGATLPTPPSSWTVSPHGPSDAALVHARLAPFPGTVVESESAVALKKAAEP
jgi:hypothetical protein